MSKRSRLLISLLAVLLVVGGVWAYASAREVTSTASLKPRVVTEKSVRVVRVKAKPRVVEIPATAKAAVPTYSKPAEEYQGATYEEEYKGKEYRDYEDDDEDEEYEEEEYEEEEYEEEEYEEEEYEEDHV